MIDEAVQPEHLLLTSRRYPFSGAAAHFVERWPACASTWAKPVWPHWKQAISSTWANRYDSDMPAVRAEPVADMDMIALGDGGVQAIALPGHAPEGLGFLVEDRSTVVVGATLPRRDLPARLDLPGAPCLTTWPASRVCSRLTSKGRGAHAWSCHPWVSARARGAHPSRGALSFGARERGSKTAGLGQPLRLRCG